MRQNRAALIIIVTGLLTFGVVFTLLQVSRSLAAPGTAAVAPVSALIPASRGAGSLAAHIAPGEVVTGLPTGGSEALLNDVQPGHWLDVLASLPLAADGRTLTAVVVTGATVLRGPAPLEPLLLVVNQPDAIALAHLVMGGTHLGYLIWPASGGPPPAQTLDERTARSLLGLAPLANPAPTLLPTPTEAPLLATPAPTPTLVTAVEPSPTPRIGGFIYQAQAGDTWDTVASTFHLSAAELRQWNEASPSADLEPGTLLFVPRR